MVAGEMSRFDTRYGEVDVRGPSWLPTGLDRLKNQAELNMVLRRDGKSRNRAKYRIDVEPAIEFRGACQANVYVEDRRNGGVQVYTQEDLHNFLVAGRGEKVTVTGELKRAGRFMVDGYLLPIDSEIETILEEMWREYVLPEIERFDGVNSEKVQRALSAFEFADLTMALASGYGEGGVDVYQKIKTALVYVRNLKRMLEAERLGREFEVL